MAPHRHCAHCAHSHPRTRRFANAVQCILVVPQLPVTAFKLVCFNRWCAGVGSFTEHVKLMAPDQSTVVRENKMKFELERPEVSRSNVHLFGNVEFTEAGVYHIEVIVDDVLKLRYPFPVILMPPKEEASTN